MDHIKKHIPLIAAILQLAVSLGLLVYTGLLIWASGLFGGSFPTGIAFVSVCCFLFSLSSLLNRNWQKPFFKIYNYSALMLVLLGAAIYGVIRYRETLEDKAIERNRQQRYNKWQQNKRKSPRVLLEITDTTDVDELVLYDEQMLEGKVLDITPQLGVNDLSAYFPADSNATMHCILCINKRGGVRCSPPMDVVSYSDIHLHYSGGSLVLEELTQEFH